MRVTLAVLAVVLVVLGAAGAAVWWKYSGLFDKPSNEIVQLDDQKRALLTRLRHEEKFEPNEYPPLGYTGVATPEEGVVARAAVNDVLDAILSRENGPVDASTVSNLIGRGMNRVNLLETEDRDRTAGYMVEIWHVLGFKGATGQFAYGAAFQKPRGYGEPLPPGWKSPTQPRPDSKYFGRPSLVAGMGRTQTARVGGRLPFVALSIPGKAQVSGRLLWLNPRG